MDSEAELLARARRYSFRARMDKGEIAGPVFVSGQGSEVEDVTGKRWLDFNSGQMCAALGITIRPSLPRSERPATR